MCTGKKGRKSARMCACVCVCVCVQVKDGGYELEHDGRLVTVFSAPNYCDQVRAAFVLVLVRVRVRICNWGRCMCGFTMCAPVRMGAHPGAHIQAHKCVHL